MDLQPKYLLQVSLVGQSHWSLHRYPKKLLSHGVEQSGPTAPKHSIIKRNMKPLLRS